MKIMLTLDIQSCSKGYPHSSSQFAPNFQNKVLKFHTTKCSRFFNLSFLPKLYIMKGHPIGQKKKKKYKHPIPLGGPSASTKWNSKKGGALFFHSLWSCYCQNSRHVSFKTKWQWQTSVIICHFSFQNNSVILGYIITWFSLLAFFIHVSITSPIEVK